MKLQQLLICSTGLQLAQSVQRYSLLASATLTGSESEAQERGWKRKKAYNKGYCASYCISIVAEVSTVHKKRRPGQIGTRYDRPLPYVLTALEMPRASEVEVNQVSRVNKETRSCAERPVCLRRGVALTPLGPPHASQGHSSAPIHNCLDLMWVKRSLFVPSFDLSIVHHGYLLVFRNLSS